MAQTLRIDVASGEVAQGEDAGGRRGKDGTRMEGRGEWSVSEVEDRSGVWAAVAQDLIEAGRVK